MSFLGDIGSELGLGLAGESAIGSITGQTAADAALAAAQTQAEAGQQASALLDPFQQVGQQGLGLSGFLGDPNAQFDFLQNNPLFQLALQNANQGTNAAAAAGGRLSAGDTLQQLSNNVLLSAQPLIDRQRQDIFGLLGIGTGVASQQGNLLTDIGATQAAGQIGAANAQGQGIGNLINLAGTIGAFSDSRLKEDAEIVGKKNGFNLWSWTWNKDAWEKFGLRGRSKGVMFSDVLDKTPEATSYQEGYGKVNYQMIGITPEFI